MSRNIGSTSCKICLSDVVLTGPTRPIQESDTGAYLFPNYDGMLVAEAACPKCQAKYLAWVGRSPQATWLRDRGGPFYDLSFHHSFDDEPAAEDLPTPEMLRVVHAAECRVRAEHARQQAHDSLVEAEELERDATEGKSFWEGYRR